MSAREAAAEIVDVLARHAGFEPCTTNCFEPILTRFEQQIHQRLISDIGAVRDMLTFVEASPDTKTILQTQIMALTEMMAGGGSHPDAQEK